MIKLFKNFKESKLEVISIILIFILMSIFLNKIYLFNFYVLQYLKNASDVGVFWLDV